MTEIVRDLEGKISFLQRQAKEYKAKIKPVPKSWAGLSTRGQENLDLRKKVKYFKQQINLGQSLLQRREDLNREIISLKKGTSSSPNNDLDKQKSKIKKMLEEKKELDLQIKKAGQRKKKHFISTAKLHINKQITEAIKDYKAKGRKEEEQEEDSLDKEKNIADEKRIIKRYQKLFRRANYVYKSRLDAETLVPPKQSPVDLPFYPQQYLLHIEQ